MVAATSYVGGIVGGSQEETETQHGRYAPVVRRPLRLGPLPCAAIVAVVIALGGAPAPTVPAGTTVDDRIDDVLEGVVGGPLVTSARGVGAPLHTDQAVVWMWSRGTSIEPGQRLRARGRLRTPRGFLSPGSPDRSIVAASRGASWELDAHTVEVIGYDDGVSAALWRWATRTQHTLAARIGGGSPGRAALRGIVTGDRAGIPPSLDERWRIVGIYHVLSVSGLHLAVIAGLAFWLLRRLVAASPWGGRTRPARWAAPIALVLAIGYTLVTGAQLATLRALLVVTVMLVGQMLDRPVRLLDAIGVAAIAILVWRPQDLHDASFQLSFTAAIALALRPAVHRTASSRRARFVRWLVRGVTTSAWVALATAPITALHFHQVAAGGVIGNLVLTPVVELLALPLGLAGSVAGPLGTPLIAIAVALVTAVDELARVLAWAIPVGSIAIDGAPWAAGLVAVTLRLSAPTQRRRTDAAFWALACAAWLCARSPAPHGTLRLTFLDVGQGDAALIELPGGEVWLVDAGGLASSRDLAIASSPGRAIERALGVYGHDAIDLVILSHPHPDHYLGLAALTVPVRELWLADDVAPAGPTSLATISAPLVARGMRIVRPSLGTISRSGVDLVVLAPRLVASDGAAEELAPDPVRSTNDNSLVVMVRYANRTILFAGDLEHEGEEALVAAGLAPVDIVKVAHHGSKTSSSPVFVAATRPRLAVISCGVANQFGFPDEQVVERWRRAGAEVARTDRDGSITVTVGPTGQLVIDRFVRP
jgi:competence protein ComEC